MRRRLHGRAATEYGLCSRALELTILCATRAKETLRRIGEVDYSTEARIVEDLQALAPADAPRRSTEAGS